MKEPECLKRMVKDKNRETKSEDPTKEKNVNGNSLAQGGSRLELEQEEN